VSGVRRVLCEQIIECKTRSGLEDVKEMCIETFKTMAPDGYNMISRDHVSKSFRSNMSVRLRKKGLFGFDGVILAKRFPEYPDDLPWRVKLRYNGGVRSFGFFIDPVSPQVVHDLVMDEIYGG
jgi:hypothetical protein